MVDRRDLEHALQLEQELANRRATDPLYNFRPTTKQRPFIDTVLKGDHFDVWFVAANRAGKSDAGAYAGATLARYGVDDPGIDYGAGIEVRDHATSGWVVSLDYNTSRDTIQPKYFNNGYGGPGTDPFIPDREVTEWPTQHNPVLKLKNGSIIGFKHCLGGDEPVTLADGSIKPIREVRIGDEVAVRRAFGRSGIETRYARVTDVMANGVRDVVRVRIRGGRSIVCTPDHELWTGTRWVRADALTKGQRISYHGEPAPKRTRALEIDPWMLGLILGDGCMTRAGLLLAIYNPIVLAEVQNRAGCQVRHSNGGTYHVSDGHIGPFASRIKAQLVALGVWGLRSGNKVIPDALYSAPDEQIEQFLSGLFAADGTLSEKPAFCLSTTSENLARGTQRLLDRLGIRSGVYPVRWSDSWRVQTMGRGALHRFHERIGWMRDPERAQRIVEATEKRKTPECMTVEAVESAEPQEVYDIEVEGLHCFNVGPIVAHNCSQDRVAFQGAEKDWIHFDEEPDFGVWQESVIRVGRRRLRVFGTCTLLPPEGQLGGVSWLFSEVIQPWQEGQRPHTAMFGSSIYDNPYLPASEIERLEAMYPEGSASRRIRLDGEWLPGMAGSRAYTGFHRGLHVEDLGELDPRRPLAWIWDFNVEPMVSLIAQRVGRRFQFHDEIILEEGSISDMVEAFVERYPRHGAEILIYGDATGKNRHHHSNRSSYQLILNEMKMYRAPCRLKVPESNPPIKDRLNAVNRLFKDEYGEVRIQVDPKCRELIGDFEGVLTDRQGKIKKTNDRKDPYYRRTHTSDAAGYYLSWEEPVRALDYGASSPMGYPAPKNPGYSTTKR